VSNKPPFPYFFALGFQSLFEILGIKRVFKSGYFRVSITVTLLLTSFCIYLESDCHRYFTELVDIAISLFPSLIGFALAGYAIVIGSGSQLVLDRTLQKDPEDKFTLYQVTNSVWGFILLVNVTTLLLAFILKVLSNIDSEIDWEPPHLIAKAYNLVGISILLFFSVYSILLHIRMVRLIFDYGQKLFCFSSEPKMSQDEKEKAIIEMKKVGGRKKKK
jgi:hypothetical protein